MIRINATNSVFRAQKFSLTFVPRFSEFFFTFYLLLASLRSGVSQQFSANRLALLAYSRYASFQKYHAILAINKYGTFYVCRAFSIVLILLQLTFKKKTCK